jgi:hypothetical protein
LTVGIVRHLGLAKWVSDNFDNARAFSFPMAVALLYLDVDYANGSLRMGAANF